MPNRAEAAVWYSEHLGFEVDVFCAFARSLPNDINGAIGKPLMPNDIVDFDLCWAYDLADPWGNQYELNCYEYDRIKTDLIDAERIIPTRYWERDQYAAYRARSIAAERS